MKFESLTKTAELLFAIFIILMFFGTFFSIPANAQGFSGSSQDQYRCVTPVVREGDENPITCEGPFDSGARADDCPGVPAGRYVCVCTDEMGVTQCANATPLPPSLRVLEFWFVRILYAIWAFSGIAFTFILIFLGFRYMTSRGEEAVIQDVVKRIKYWVIGILLVFLAYPVLNTVFGAIGISESECFQDIQMPAFQIFFPESC